MKLLVLYQSQCGSTKKYAEDIAKQCSGDVFPIKKFKEKHYKDYDTIVFGGWVDNAEIKGLNDFLSNWDKIKDKNVIVFSTGISEPSDHGRTLQIETNLLNMYHLRFYQLRGSFNIKNLKFPYSLIVKTVIKRVENNPNASIDQKTFVTLRDNPINYYDLEGIEKICKVIRKLDSIESKI